MNKKILWGFVAVVVLVGAFFVFSNKQQVTSIVTKQSIKIGFMLPLTGQFGAIGEGVKNAGMMAVEDYNLSHPNVTVSIVNEDDGFDVKMGIPAYTKLTTIDKVSGIMMISTPIIDAIHEKMNADGLPIVSIGLQNNGVAPDNIFQTTLAPIAPIEFMAKFVDSKNHTKTAVIYNNAFSATKSFYDAFVKNYTKQHVDFVVTDAQSANVAATKIMSSGFDSVVILEDAVGGPLVTKDLKTLDTKNKLAYYYDLQLSTGWAEYKKLLGDTNKLNGAYALKIKGGDTSIFTQKYKAKYGTDPTPYAEYGYDSAMILLNNYNTNQETWISNIQATSFVGPSGKITFDKDGVRLQETEMNAVENGSVTQ